MMAQRDPWVNMLRTTLAAFAAGVGGADTVLVQPFDAAIPGGLPGTAASFARRMARNTQLLLLEESHVGRVLDPGGGSWFVEDLTRAARRGGVGALPGHRVPRRLRRSPRLRRRADRRGRASAGATTSPTDGPPSRASTSIRTWPKRLLPHREHGSGVVPVRGRRSRRCGTGPTPISRRPALGRGPLLLPLGPLAEHNIRTTFAANLLASGGVETVNPGTVDAARRRRSRVRGGAPDAPR